MKQDQKDKLASLLGIPKEVQETLDITSDHPFNCRCDRCLEWWVCCGPETTPEGRILENNYGPFSRDEIIMAKSGIIHKRIIATNKQMKDKVRDQEIKSTGNLSAEERKEWSQMATDKTLKYKNVLEPDRSLEFKERKANGFSVVVSPPDVLQLDFDNLENVRHCFKVQNEFEKLMELKIIDRFMLPSKSAVSDGYIRFHQYVRFNQPIPITDKPWYQTMLGSDPIRERICFYRIKQEINHPIVFLEQDISVIPIWAIQELI